jgi:hypothetical protein
MKPSHCPAIPRRGLEAGTPHKITLFLTIFLFWVRPHIHACFYRAKKNVYGLIMALLHPHPVDGRDITEKRKKGTTTFVLMPSTALSSFLAFGFILPLIIKICSVEIH